MKNRTKNAIRIVILLSLSVVLWQCAAQFASDLQMSGFSITHKGRIETIQGSTVAKLTFEGIPEFVGSDLYGETIIFASRNRGVWISNDNGNNFGHENLMQIPMLGDAENQRSVYAIDAAAGLLTHKHDIMLRVNAPNEPARWEKLHTDMTRSSVFTAIHRGKNHIYLGTSVNALQSAPLSETAFQKWKTGAPRTKLKFSKISRGLPGKPHNAGHFIFEEIRAMAESPNGDLWVVSGPQLGLYKKNAGNAAFHSIPLSLQDFGFNDCQKLSVDLAENVLISCRSGLITGNAKTGTFMHREWQSILPDKSAYQAAAFKDPKTGLVGVYRAPSLPATGEKLQRMQAAQNQKIFYASSMTYQKYKKRVLDELASPFWTGMVIDVKDDFGLLRYASKVPFAKKMNAVRARFDLSEVIEAAHNLKKRLIVRIVVFKDEKLFSAPGFAILTQGGQPWIGSPNERWIDPFNPKLLTDYYIPLVRELTALGVDEIQLDYIRFPSDGAVGNCRYSHKTGDLYASEALENFIRALRQETHVTLSADIYGYNGMYRAPGVIGQDLEALGQILDVISPMHYSSHFGDDYMRELPRDERAYALLRLAVGKGTYIAQNQFLIRPYLQAFDMKKGLWGYGKKYFADQVRGSIDGGASGFLFWGTLDNMTAVRKALTEPEK